jgi:glycosyltransferase involved in cell wall biosynthesis
VAAPLKVLLVCFYFPPAGGGGVQRPLKLARYLPEFGIETHVLAPTDPHWIHRDESLEVPAQAHVHRAPFPGPRGRLPAEELYGLKGTRRLARKAAFLPRRLLLPDETVLWLPRALPAARRIVREQGIDVVITTSPPLSVHLIGASLKRRLGVRWIADLRDSMVAKPDRHFERRLVRIKERSQRHVARLVASRADAIATVTPSIVAEMRGLGASCEIALISNGADFDDFAGVPHEPGSSFRISHTGNFFGKRDPRPFLNALAHVIAPIRAGFIGDFRASDRERNADVLLLLIPDRGARSRGVASGKLYEYLAARRPILALAPSDGVAAGLIRDAGAGIVVAPDDEQAIKAALHELIERWGRGDLPDIELAPGLRERIDRRARVREFAELIEKVAGR